MKALDKRLRAYGRSSMPEPDESKIKDTIVSARKSFYEEAFRFIEKKFGSEYVVSAVMHADEINKAATDDLGKDVYHYHLHAVVLPVIEKEIRLSQSKNNLIKIMI